VSSDPIADLAKSLDNFVTAFRGLLGSNRQPAPGSPAAREAEGEPFADEWGERPSSDVFAVTVLLAASCTDYLMGVVDILQARNTVYASYALTRAAAEAAAIDCYLTDKDIDALERLRRTTNFRLDGLCEQISMVEVFRSDEAASKVAHNQTRIEAFGRSGYRHGLDFHKAKGPGKPARLGDAQPSAMRLMGPAIDKDSPDLGATYQRLLSSVTHSGLHGLTRFLTPLQANEGRPGEALAALNVNARELAVELVVGPLCAATLAANLTWFTGWDASEVVGPANAMLLTWARIGAMPVPDVANKHGFIKL